MSKAEKQKNEKTLLEKLGIPVQTEPVPHIKWEDLRDFMDKNFTESQKERFDTLFGVQTCHIDGPYPWDVETVLQRMAPKNFRSNMGIQLLL